MPVAQELLKLNLGSNDRKVKGFMNFDRVDYPGVDFIGDVTDLSRFTDESVGEIIASHILEHFSHKDTVKVLKEWHRVLAKGGKLMVSVPDLEVIVDIIKGTENGASNPWVTNILYGDQNDKQGFHYVCFTAYTLEQAMRSAGFYGIERVEVFGLDGCSTLMYGNGIPVSLNMVGEK